MATDALAQNPGYVDGASIVLLDMAAETPLAQQIEARIRNLYASPAVLTHMGQAGQAVTRRLYAPERQIGQRQAILRSVAAQLGLPVLPPLAAQADTAEVIVP